MVEPAGDAKIVVVIGCLIVQQGGVVEVFDLARAKDRRGDSEDDVVVGCGGIEAGLPQAAGAGIGTAGDGEDGFHSAIGRVGIGCAIGVKEEGETNFPRGAVGGDKERRSVTGSDAGADELELGVYSWT